MRRSKKWVSLDNAAKIFPPATGERDPKVFRFSCELYENVDKLVLQEAVEKAIIQFPNFSVVMKKGLFWYYLEESFITPKVKEEYKAPCRAIYDRNIKKLLFEVTYYKKRINLEMYHVLTDGTGALQFLKLILVNYFLIRNPEGLKDILTEVDYDASNYQKNDDSFQKYYDRKSKRTKKLKFAYQLTGNKINRSQIKIIEGVMPLNKLVDKAHEYNCTLTALISAIFMKAIDDEREVKYRKKPMILEIPVNLRKYFDSGSARNFFGLINIEYKIEKEPMELKDMIQYTNNCIREELKEDKLKERMNALIAIEHNFIIRPIPLILKNIILKVAVKFLSWGRTTSLSNVGSINMPERIKKGIKLFDIMVSTKGLQACMCSYENNLVLSFSSVFESTDIQKRVFRTLSEMGIEITLVTNKVDD